MTIGFDRQRYSLLLLSYLVVYAFANNETLSQLNGTLVELNSTSINATTFANVSDVEETTVSSSEPANTTLLSILINSSISLSTLPDETTATAVIDSNTTVQADTESVQLNQTQAYIHSTTTGVDEETTITTTKASCEWSTYGCCADGLKERYGKIERANEALIF